MVPDLDGKLDKLKAAQEKIWEKNVAKSNSPFLILELICLTYIVVVRGPHHDVIDVSLFFLVTFGSNVETAC